MNERESCNALLTVADTSMGAAKSDTANERPTMLMENTPTITNASTRRGLKSIPYRYDMTSVPGIVTTRLRATPPTILERTNNRRETGRVKRYEARSLMYFSLQMSRPD